MPYGVCGALVHARGWL